jgi:hypothetical protein
MRESKARSANRLKFRVSEILANVRFTLWRNARKRNRG